MPKIEREEEGCEETNQKYQFVLGVHGQGQLLVSLNTMEELIFWENRI